MEMRPYGKQKQGQASKGGIYKIIAWVLTGEVGKAKAKLELK